MKRHFDIKNLCLISIMTSINIIFVILNLFFSLFSLIILIGIPLGATIIKLKVSTKYQLIYLLSSILICSLIDFQISLFYIIPGLITGFIFGLLVNKKVHGFLIIIITSLFNIILQWLSFYIIKYLFNADMISFFANLFGVSLSRFKDIYLVFLFLISLIQMLFSYFVIEEEIKKFNYSIDENYSIFYIIFSMGLFFSLLGIIVLINKSIGYLFSSLGMLFNGYLLLYLFKYRRKLINYSIIATYVLTFFISLSIFNKINDISLLFTFFSLTSSLNGVIFIIYVTIIRKEKITSLLFNKIDKKR